MTLRSWFQRRLRSGFRFVEGRGATPPVPAVPRSLLTERLGLVPVTRASLQADLDGAGALAGVLGVQVPGDWPPELYDRDAVLFALQGLQRVPAHPNWWMYYLLRRSSPHAPAVVVGCVGYKGPPEGGTAEIGYSILRAYRERGYATEAALALTEAAFRRRDVHRVIAETLPTLGASMRVLEKCGFRRVSGASAPGIIRYEMRRGRARAVLRSGP